MEIIELQKSGNTEIMCVYIYVCRQTNMTMSVLGMYEYVYMHACLYPDMNESMHMFFYVNK